MKISNAEEKEYFLSFNASTLHSTDACITKGYTKVSPAWNQVLTGQPITDSSIIELVRLSHNQIIAVTADRVWVYRPESVDDIGLLPQLFTNKTGSIATIKKLLDTAIVLGKKAALSKQKTPELNLTNWIWSLVSQYHLTHPTPELMREAARRFKVEDRQQLAKWAEEKAIEETGHDRLALLDIESLGYQAQALVQAFMPPSAKILIDYFIRSTQTSDPVNSVGYSYTLERLALAIKEKHVKAIETIIPSGIKATRCLRVHSSIGSDVEHVEEALKMIAKLSPAERNKIAIACYETAKLYFSSREDNYPAIAELEQKFQQFKY